jgi:uncharacterized protein YfaT (DUF1175 family)
MAGSAVATALAALSCVRHVTPVELRLSAFDAPADGFSEIDVVTTPSDSKLEIVEGRHLAELAAGGHVLRVGVTPGRIRLRAEAPGYQPAFATLTTSLDEGDRNQDGTPDFLRLGPADQEAFRQWFTFLAEAQYFRRDLPGEIDDCAALIRYACREALRTHDSAWAAGARLPLVPTLPDVRKYAYPFTPLQANLFRIRAGPFHPSDIADGSFAQFADAQTLERFNTHFVSRSLEQARPGDLLFFCQACGARQAGAALAFHSMVWLGPSHFDETRQRYVVYHTGPIGSRAGEIRRLTVPELLHHPEPRWRPVEGNSNFLGVYRWNIL